MILIVFLAALFDLRSRRIPNWLTVSGAVLGLGLNWFLGETSGLVFGAKGLGFAMLVYLPLYMIRAMGAGDVKLMAAIGAILGPMNWLGVFVLSALLGGPIALITAMSRGRLGQSFRNVLAILRDLAHFTPPYRRTAELDIHNPGAMTLPHGAIVALGVTAFL
ncbi:MAG: prepilin peptidase, partial [Acidobacteriia bacterium]|nr:prepilin peptidase [Terriglobia bacterium]